MTNNPESQDKPGNHQNDLSLRQIQHLIDQWIRQDGVRYFSELTNLAQLVEEVGEVARLMARLYGDQSSKPGERLPEFEDELADVLFVLVCIANQTGVDLTTAIQHNLDKKRVRDKNRHRENPKLAKPPMGPTGKFAKNKLP